MSVYLEQALARFPEILSRIDREPFSLSYGSGDRVHWCWKFTDFPGARFQEYVYTLARFYAIDDTPWHNNPKLLTYIEAGILYWRSIQYRDGSFDEAYPYERSLAATAFTSFYMAEAWLLVGDRLSEDARTAYLETSERAAQWLCKNDEHHGVLSNHLAVAAAAMHHAGDIHNNPIFTTRRDHFVTRILTHQSEEGWYEEYGGADIGYQTHGSFYLARIQQLTNNSDLLDSLQKANRFLSCFIHPDGSIGGSYASRNTSFYYPAAYEMLSAQCSTAAGIAGHQRTAIESHCGVGVQQMDSYNLYPVLNNYLFAHDAQTSRGGGSDATPLFCESTGSRDFPGCGLHVRSYDKYYAVVASTKGGVIRIWSRPEKRLLWQSGGYFLPQGRKVLSTQAYGAQVTTGDEGIEIRAPFAPVKRKLFSPPLFLGFRLFNLTVGRVPAIARTLKRCLVRTLVNKKGCASPGYLTRNIVFSDTDITITDRLDGPVKSAIHMDTFAAIHMGSSRYADPQEEHVRGTGYPAAIKADAKGSTLWTVSAS